MTSFDPNAGDERPESFALLTAIKRDLEQLVALLDASRSACEERVYRFYHQSFKVYDLQRLTGRMVDELRGLAPERPLDDWFEQIIAEGLGNEFTLADNERWTESTRPILEAHWHAQYFIEQAVTYGARLERPPAVLPYGWASLLTLYGLR